MIKALFVDLDGTLLGVTGGHDMVLPPENLEALRQLVKKEVHVCIASGRGTEHIFDQINTNYGFLFDIIANNGMAILCDGKIINERPGYDPAVLMRLAEFLDDAKEVGLFLTFGGHRHIYLNQKAAGYHKLQEMAKDWRSPNIKEKDIKEFLSGQDYNDPFKVCLYAGSYPLVIKWLAILDAAFGSEFEIFNTDSRYIEFMPKGVSKGEALKQVCAYYNFALDEVAAVGDAGNDISMLKLTPHSYVMDHAPDFVKAAAKQEISNVAEAIADIMRYNEAEQHKKKTLQSHLVI